MKKTKNNKRIQYYYKISKYIIYYRFYINTSIFVYTFL